MDEIDRHLLTLVQADAARPLHVLGELVGLSPSAVQRRLVRLRARGVIEREVALLNPRAVGATLTAVVLIALADDDRAHHEQFQARMLAEPNVQQCFAIVGQWDYVVILISRDLAENRELSRRLFVDPGTVRRYETLPASAALKSGLELPLGDQGGGSWATTSATPSRSSGAG